MFLGITEYLGPSIKIFLKLLLQSQPTHLAAVQSDVNDGNPPLTFSSFKWSFFLLNYKDGIGRILKVKGKTFFGITFMAA